MEKLTIVIRDALVGARKPKTRCVVALDFS